MSLYLAILLILVVAILVSLAHKMFLNYNQSPLRIQTFDKSDSPFHPSVLYFSNGWGGYKYWMAETPLSPLGRPYAGRWECPCIHVSNDGLEWSSVDKSSFPLDDLFDSDIVDLNYFSDPHLVFAHSKIECWYRFTRRNGIASDTSDVELRRKVSVDGDCWADRETLVHFSKDDYPNELGNMIVSPAVIHKDNVYQMWYVDKESIKGAHIRYSYSDDGKNWQASEICVLSGTKVEPWHIDVTFVGGIFYMVIYSHEPNELTLWKSVNGIHFEFVKILLRPSGKRGCFYGMQLYRSVLVQSETGFRLYFSAKDYEKTYIGVMEGENPEKLTVVDVNGWGFRKNIFEYVKAVSFHVLRDMKMTVIRLKMSIAHKIKLMLTR